MKLRHLTEERCGTCGCAAIEETQAARGHVNGGVEETRRFSCGRHVMFSPNFNRVSVIRECEKDPERQAETLRQDNLVRHLIELVRTSDVQEKAFLERLHSDLRYKLSAAEYARMCNEDFHHE